MSVGIDSLDNDHKKLIAILAQLMSAKNEKLGQDDIDVIFERLEGYCLSHFAREEALLAKIDYKQLEAHKLSHQAFIKKIPQLKEQWFAKVTESEAVKDKIILFLQQWLIKHILEEDLDYVPAIHCFQEFSRYEKDKKAKHPWLRFFSIKLSHCLILSHRVLITTLLPVAAVLLLCFFILKDNYQRYDSISKVLGLNSVIEQVNGISHSLQAERGLSTGYTSSNYRSFAKQLRQRRKSTDAKIQYFLWLLEQSANQEIKVSVSRYMTNFQEIVANLSRHRMHLDQKIVGFEETYHAYTQLIGQLLSVSDHLVHIEIGSSHANDISAINAILRYKEFMGQIRAIGMKMAENHQENIYGNVEVSLLIGKQLNTLLIFKNAANSAQKSICGHYCDAFALRQHLESSYLETMQFEDKDVRAARWFKVMSAKVDNLNSVVQRLINEFDGQIYIESQKLKKEGYLIILAMLIFLLVAIFFALVLNYSIISPVRKLTYALNDMSEGQNNIHFNHIDSKDEIGSMQLAFEKLRRKLLQGDVYKATVSQQQKEIKYRKSQQDHFQQLALTDALTGAVNRHHFNEVLDQEIANVNNHGSPLSIMLLDIDHFKSVNDRYGHGVGDEVLVMFYQTCVEAVRSSDVVARIGGEEFVIIMPNTQLVNAQKFAERLRQKIAKLELNIANNQISVTVSIGVSQWQSEYFTNAETFVAHADKSLYQAKNSGRNKVVVAQQ
ncbi:GGDEF domain protein [Colwellia psychrerythraea 34H]|uniref:diguanylate cyclase n=2 Tax=Colwellia psychrerythraea TaxID=28229 RepID=Q47Y21_COLP3|nr:GGDEF domain protein [Colwellia psychrerythraea 34H]